MGHHQHGHALLGQLLHNGQNLANHFRVQGRGGLVEEQHFRLHGQGSGDGHALLLAAGDLPGPGIDIGSHANLGQVVHGGLSGLFFGLLQHLDLAHHAVFQHGHIVEQVKALEHHAHMAAVIRGVHMAAHHILAVIEDLTGGGGLQQVDAPQESGLAGAGSADDGDHIAAAHSEVDVFENLMGAEGFAQVLDFQDLFHISGLPSCACIPCSARQMGCSGWDGNKCRQTWPGNPR